MDQSFTKLRSFVKQLDEDAYNQVTNKTDWEGLKTIGSQNNYYHTFEVITFYNICSF